MSILNNQVLVNAYNFTEKQIFGEPVHIDVTNDTARTMLFSETVFLNGFIGEVMDQDGIAAGASGKINVNPSRHISMNQVDVADAFAAQKNPIFFQPQTDSVVGFWVDTTLAGRVLFNAEVIGSAPAATPAYIEFKSPF